MKLISVLLSLCLALALLPSGSWALTGPGATATKSGEEEVTLELMDAANNLREIAPEVSVDDALMLAQLLKDVRNDEYTKAILVDMKSGKFEQDKALRELIKASSPKDIVVGMTHIFDELKALESLFQNPQRAVEEVSKEGMITDESRLNAYRADPELLEEDMKSGLYFSFVSFALAGGYL